MRACTRSTSVLRRADEAFICIAPTKEGGGVAMGLDEEPQRLLQISVEIEQADRSIKSAIEWLSLRLADFDAQLGALLPPETVIRGSKRSFELRVAMLSRAHELAVALADLRAAAAGLETLGREAIAGRGGAAAQAP